MATTTRAAARPHQVLDPRTMGRPVHLLGKFTEQLRKELAELFHTSLNRPYRSRFEVGEVSLDGSVAPHGPQRWLTFGSSSGRVNFALDRSILLCILGYRYGTHGEAEADGTDTVQTEPETATEERLAARLGRQLASVIAARIDALQPDTEPGPPAPADEFTEIAGAPLEGAWTLRVSLAEPSRNVAGTLWFRLEEAWIARLLRALAPARERSKMKKSGAAVQPLPARLQLTLTARLFEKQMRLGTLLDLRNGDVIPITLGTTDVLIGDSRLFTASVAEHKGKLCLTSFEDVE